MSITLASITAKLDTILGDIISGTTTSAGKSDKTSLVDSGLAHYPDDYFVGYTAFLTASEQEQHIKEFLSPSGTLVVWKAFSAQVESSIAYKLYRFSQADKKLALNQALFDSFPSFYKYVRDETLWGQNAYGEESEDAEFDKYKYDVPSGFYGFPDQIWLRECYKGKHTGSDAAAALTDGAANWETDELVGETIRNKTDGSTGTVTANTATTVTATLSGGTNNDWDEDDEYIVPKPNKKPEGFYDFKPLKKSDGTWEFYASIGEKYAIILLGKQQLTQFTNAASTTELDNAQAEILRFGAAANLFRMYANKIDVQDTGRFESLADRWEAKFYALIKEHPMGQMYPKMKVDWSWAE